MTGSSLEAAGLGFSYGRLRPQRVFSDLDWAVTAGETTLLLGPNGAGKSTLMKLLSGFHEPDAGTVTIDGRAGRRALFREVAWMPQDVQPGRGLTVSEQVEYVGWVGGLSRSQARQRAREAIASVDLEDKRDVRTARLSGGQLRRVGLAQALVRRSRVLLLDEPTAGLDPAQAINFRKIIRNLDYPGGIVISTHQVNDLVDDVDRVAIMAAGRIVFDGAPGDLIREQSRSPGTPVTVEQAFARLVGGGRH